MEDFDKSIEYLEELVRTAYKQISPSTYEDDLENFTNKEWRDKFISRHPQCFMNLKKMYGDHQGFPLFPICNRGGVNDAKVINFSIKLATKLMDDERFEVGEMKAIVLKLKHMKARYDKENPKPVSAAVRKANDTKNLKKNMK